MLLDRLWSRWDSTFMSCSLQLLKWCDLGLWIQWMSSWRSFALLIDSLLLVFWIRNKSNFGTLLIISFWLAWMEESIWIWWESRVLEMIYFGITLAWSVALTVVRGAEVSCQNALFHIELILVISGVTWRPFVMRLNWLFLLDYFWWNYQCFRLFNNGGILWNWSWRSNRFLFRILFLMNVWKSIAQRNLVMGQTSR